MNSIGSDSEAGWRTSAHLAIIERHPGSLIALNEAWCVGVSRGAVKLAPQHRVEPVGKPLKGLILSP